MNELDALLSGADKPHHNPTAKPERQSQIKLNDWEVELQKQVIDKIKEDYSGMGTVTSISAKRKLYVDALKAQAKKLGIDLKKI